MGLTHAGFNLIAFLNAHHALPILFVIVPSFFALSGFLVAGSLERNTIPTFLTLRAIRIVPALAVEVFLSALLIGPIVTSLPLSAYFTDPEFFSYFLNIVGDIHFTLPGAFENNPLPGMVNGQLWTIPFELKCYSLITLAGIAGLVRFPRLFFAVSIVAALAMCGRVITAHTIPADLGALPLPPGTLSVLAFLFGAALYFNRSAIPFSAPVGIISAGLSWVLMTRAETLYLASLPIAYTTVYVGLLSPPKIWLIKGADYSYGIYLYGFPLQQIVTHFLPDHLRFAVLNFAVAVPLAWLCAWASWHLVEKQALDRKQAMTRLADLFAARLTGKTAHTAATPQRVTAPRER